MSVKGIVYRFLVDGGYDGLVSDGGECACFLDDLAPCGEDWRNCEPGHKGPCRCGEGCDHDIYRERSDVQAMLDAAQTAQEDRT